MSLADAIASVKADADKHWRYEEPLTAVQYYVAAMRQTGLPESAADVLRAIYSGEGDGSVRAAAAAVALLVDPECTDARDIICGKGSAVPTDEKAVQMLAAAFGLIAKSEAAADSHHASGIKALRDAVPAVAGNAASNLALCCTGLRLWPQVLVASTAAALFNPALCEKNAQRFRIAAAQLGVFDIPLEHLPGSADVQSTVDTIRAEQGGSYNLAAFSKGAGALPTAEYFAPMHAGASEGRGYGMFTDRDLKAGEVILCEHAVGHTTVSEAGASKDGVSIWLKTATQLPFFGHRMARVVSVYDGSDRRAEDMADANPHLATFRHHPLIFDDGPAKQTDEHLEQAVALNANQGVFVAERRSSDWAAVGLFPAVALMNHDIGYNVIMQCFGCFQVAIAARDIAAGEELFNTYINAMEYLAEEQPLGRWGITLPRAAEFAEVKSLYDSLHSIGDTAAVFAEAEPKLRALEPQCRRAFIADAAMVAAVAGAPATHPCIVALKALLSDEAPDLAVMQHCATLMERSKKRIKAPTRNDLRSALEAGMRGTVGHTNLAALVATF